MSDYLQSQKKQKEWRLCKYEGCSAAFQQDSNSEGQKTHDRNYHGQLTRTKRGKPMKSKLRHPKKLKIGLKEARVRVERLTASHLFENVIDLKKSGKSPCLLILPDGIQIRKFRIDIVSLAPVPKAPKVTTTAPALIANPKSQIDLAIDSLPRGKRKSALTSQLRTAKIAKCLLGAAKPDLDQQPKGYEEDGDIYYSPSEPDSDSDPEFKAASESFSTPAKPPTAEIISQCPSFPCSHSGCGRVFSRAFLCRVHERIHTGMKPYKCEQCGKAFINSSQLINHSKTHLPRNVREKYACKDCGMKFVKPVSSRHVCNRNKALEQGIIEVEIPLEERIVGDEDLEFDPLADANHNLQPSAKNPEASSSTKNALIHVDLDNILTGRRSEVEVKNEPLTAGCPRANLQANAVAPSLKDWQENSAFVLEVEEVTSIETKHNISIDTYDPFAPDVKEEQPIYLTEYPTQNIQTFQTTPGSELVQQNQGPQPYKRLFTVPNTYTPTTRTPNTDGVFECRFCDKSFPSRSTVNRHEKRHEDRRFICDFPLCGKVLATERGLKDHAQTHYAGASKHVCKDCGKRYRQAHGLLAHVRSVHTLERPFKCTYCEERFGSTNSKKLHESRVHTGLRPWQCRFCEKRCLQRFQLVWHERVHTGEKPLNCSFCNKAFSRPNTLQKHMGRIHLGHAHKYRSFRKKKTTTVTVQAQVPDLAGEILENEVDDGVVKVETE